jgi:predicted outer membrane repeat protein
MRSIFSKPQILILTLLLSALKLSAQVPGTSLTFDGTDDYVNCGTLPSPAQFTVEAWVYPQKSGTDMSIVSNLHETSNFNFEIHINSTGKPVVTARGSSGWVDAVADNAISLNKWYHLASTYDGTTLSLYVNGSLVKSAALTGYVRSSFNFYIGCRPGTAAPALYRYTGAIDEVRYWEVARTATQIQQNMMKELSGGEAGLLVYYKFDNQTGSTLSDTRGLYNASLISFALTGSTSNWTSSFALPATNVCNTGFTASWQTIDMATKYRVDVSDRLDFSNLIIDNFDAGTATSKSFTGLSLNAGQTYYYRVRYESAYGTSSNSLPVSFSPSPGNAIALDGTDDYISVPAMADKCTTFTIETWLSLRSYNTTNVNRLFTTTAGDVNGNNVHFQILNSNELELYINNTARYKFQYRFELNKWYHVAAVFAANGSLQLFVNGNNIGNSTAFGAGYVYFSAARIGYLSNGDYHIGLLDEFRIWKTARTQAEIQANMYSELSGSDANLMLYYKFNQGTGSGNNSGLTNVIDATTNGRNGILTNSTLNGNTSNYVVSGACAPIVYEATNINSTGFTANWNAITGATKYRIDVSDRSDFSNLLVLNVDAGTGTSYSVTGLSLIAGTTYYYRVWYESALGNSVYTVKKFMPKAGNAIAFDGLDDYVACPAVNPTTFTYEAWINPSVLGKDQAVVSTLTSNVGAELHINSDNKLWLTLWTGSAWKDISSTTTLSTGTWYHIAGTYDGTTAIVYLNGSPVSATTTYSAGTTALNIGRRSNASLPFSGKIDNVAVWGRALSATEIQNTMFASLAGNESGLQAYYNFDQGIANGINTGLTVIPDLSQHGNTGTLTYSALLGTSSNYVTSEAMNYILNATSVTTTGFTANWTAVPNASNYRIDVSTQPDFSTLITNGNDIDAGSGTSFVVTGLTLNSGTNYYYRMRYKIASQSYTSPSSVAKVVQLASGNALAFDGTDDYVDLHTMSPTGNFSTGFTYMGWVKWDAFQSWSRLFDLGIGSNNNNILLATNGTANGLDFSNRIGTTEGYILTGSILPTGQWVHIAATINNVGYGVVYVNGQIAASGNMYAPNNIARTTCYLGKSNWPDAYFKGSMDEVSFWTKALTAQEINAYMIAPPVGNETDLYAYYKFNQGNPGGINTGITTLTDVTANAKTGDLTNYTILNTANTTSNWVSSPVIIAPFVYNATNVTTTGFTANWKAVTGATGYRIDVSDKSDFSNLLVNNANAGNGISYIVNGLNLSLGANYYYRMRNETASGSSCNSPVKTFMVGMGNSLNIADGVADYIDVPQLGNSFSDATIETWINVGSFPYLNELWTVNRYNVNGSPHFQFYSGNLGFTVFGNAPELIYFDYPFTANKWYHVAITYSTSGSPKQAVAYVNGVEVKSITLSTSYPLNIYNSRIGSWIGDNSRWCLGYMDNFRIWSKARSQAEIQSTMNAEVVGNEANLLLSYNFNQGVPNGNNTLLTSLPDATGTYSGVLTGFTLNNGAPSNYTNLTPSRNVFYVNASAANGGNGLSPASAFNNLAAAFAAATGEDTIKVAKGNYCQPAYNVSLVNSGKSLTLLGGYNGSFTSRNATTNLTTISGASGATASIIYVTDCNLTIDGLTFINGNSSVRGGAIRYYSQTSAYNINLSNCIFQNNKAPAGNGGAIDLNSEFTSAVANISNCIFKSNTANYNGGAIGIARFKTSITNCNFDNNSSTSSGGAISYWIGNLSVQQCSFTNNRTPANGSAIEINSATVNITNNTFFGNNAIGTGTIHLAGDSYLNLYHNTIVGNTSGNCGGLSNYITCNVYMYGNIISGNTGGQSQYQDIWNQPDGNGYTGNIFDRGYNLFSSGSFNKHDFSQWVNTDQLYNILESTTPYSGQRLFPANVANNGGVTPSIKVIGRTYKNSTGVTFGVRTLPRSTYNVTTDQRGNGRLFKAATIGAYEMDIDTTKNVIYVNGNLAATGDGSLANPYNNLQIAIAASANDTIKIAGATYSMPGTGLAFGNNCSNGLRDVILLGAYDKDFKIRDTVTNRTILQNLNSTVPIIWHINSNLTVENITFKNGFANSSTYEGAAIHFYAASGTYSCNIRNCIFTGNTLSSGNGGALYINAASAASIANIINCTFNGNKASSGAGGALATTTATVNIANSTFVNNSSTNAGGAIYKTIGSLNVTNSTFYNNTSSTNAGAIWSGTSASTALISNTIVGNVNSSTTYGAGAIDCASGIMSLQGNIIAGNKSGLTVAFDVWQEGGVVTDNGYNIFGTNGAFQFTPNDSSIIINNDQLHRILESTLPYVAGVRLFPAKIANNGGATPTVKIIGKYFNNSSGKEKNIRKVPANLSLTTDQRGVARTVGVACIGAYEMNAADKYVYVNINSAAGGDGSFSKPYNDLATALKYSVINDTIKVATGNYIAPDTSFVITKNIVVIGGYNSTFSQLEPKLNPTVIKYSGATGNVSLIKIKNTSAEINGFTIRDAVANTNGGGVNVSITGSTQYNIVFKKCYFTANTANSSAGGAIYLASSASVNSNVSVLNCTFESNTSGSHGGAIYSDGRFNTQIINSTFYGNAAGNSGGAIYQGTLGTMLLKQNTIVGNTGSVSACGGVTCDGGTLNILANIIAKNTSALFKHDVYKASGTLTDIGYNIVGSMGYAGWSIASTTDSIITAQLNLLLTSPSNFGGSTPTMKLLKKAYINAKLLAKTVNVVPATVTGNLLETTDQRGVNRETSAMCIGAFEYRDSVQTKNITVTTTTANAVAIHFTPGSFSKRVAFMKKGTASTELPANGSTYTASNIFGNGTQIGTGWYCVYNGNDSVFTVTGLLPIENYAVKVFEYNENSYYYTNLTGATNNPKSFVTPQLVQTISFNNVSKNWGDADFTLPDTTSLGLNGIQYNSSNTAVATISGNNVHITGVGTTIIKANHNGNTTVAPAQEVSRSLVVNADTLFITAANTNSKYGEVPAFNFTSSGLKNKDSIIIKTGVTYASAANNTADIGSYEATPSAAVFATGRGNAANYIIKYIAGNHSITPATLTITADNKDKFFADANPGYTATISGLKSTDQVSVTLTCQAEDGSAVGNYSITPSNAVFTSGKAGNYAIQYITGALAIKAAPLTIQADNKTKVYGTANPPMTYVPNGLKGTDIIEDLKLVTSAGEFSDVGTYEIIPSQLSLKSGQLSNYSISYSNGNMVVTKANLTISAENKNKKYGNSNPVFTFVPSGLSKVDSIGSVEMSTEANETSGIGEHIITCGDAKFVKGLAANYNISYNNGTLKINPAILTIKADNKDRAYFSSKNPDLTITYDGFVNNEDASVLTSLPVVNCTAVKTSKVGTYPIDISGALADNYVITYVTGLLTITESPVQICLVSIDKETEKNMIVWERKNGFGIKYYNVYRETSVANDYELLGMIPFSKEGVYVDLTSKPKNQQHRYKISAVDSSGNESVMSLYHEPTFLQYNNSVNGINLTWKPYEIENGKLEFKSYALYRGTDSSKLELLTTLSANSDIYIDTDPQALKKLMFYRIVGVLNGPCNSQTILKAGGGPFSEAVSNLEDNRLRFAPVGVSNRVNKSFFVYPNPASDYITVTYSLEIAGNVEFEISNLMGATIAKINAGETDTNVSSFKIDIAYYNLQSGTYYLKLKTKDEIGVKRVSIVR